MLDDGRPANAWPIGREKAPTSPGFYTIAAKQDSVKMRDSCHQRVPSVNHSLRSEQAGETQSSLRLIL